jgi:hypothetical protein
MEKFEMTYNEAMTIQRAQMAWYRRTIGRQGCKAIRQHTKPCPGNPNKPMSIIEINGLVPRGGCFESYIKTYPKDIDPTRAAMHNAIRRGLI